MKRILEKVIIITILFIAVMYISSYASNLEFNYELDSNNYATITSYKGSNTEITIPKEIDGYEVKKIGEHAFDESRNNTNGKTLTKVIISEGITTIGDFAFVHCTNLERIKLPESLTSLGDQTFIGCTNLKEINIPSKITSLGLTGFMFQETGFEEFTIPENVKKIPGNTFRICKNLKKVVFYSNNVILGSNVFEYCSEDLVLYGYQGSTIQSYARNNGLTFKDINMLSTDIPVEKVTLNKYSLSLEIGKTETLIATVNPNNATDNTLTWSSNKTDIVTVNSTGTITAKAEGVAIITVKAGEKSATCTVTVTNNEEDKDKGFSIIGTIEIPKTNVKYPISGEPSRKALEVAVAALYPLDAVLNSKGNVVIIGHNYRNGTFFSNNKKLSVGDEIYITGLNNDKITYYVYKVFETDENDTSFYNRETNGKREITLSTVTDDGTKRLIILASETKYQKEKEDNLKVEDNTVADKEMPNTGRVYLFGTVIMFLLIIIILYHKKEQYKKV